MMPSSRTITALTCPECHALAGDPPSDCDYCESGGKLLPVDYCLASERDAAVARAERAERVLRKARAYVDFTCENPNGCIYTGPDARSRGVIGSWCAASGECCYQGDAR